MENFKAKLSEFGLFPENIEVTDKIKRFAVDGKNLNGWYFFQQVGDDSYGAMGNWANGLSETYSSFSPGKSEKEIEQIKKDFERIKKESELLRGKEAEKVALKAQSMWDGLKEGPHPYLKKKQINANGARRYKNSLVIPIYKNNEIVSLQFIDSSGKRFMSGGITSGGAYPIKGGREKVVICEGFATGASINESTGYQVFVAFNAGNLLKVAKRVKEICPNSEIIIACDNDMHKEINTGVIQGTKAAELINCFLAIPEFKINDGKSTDFNDLFVIEGKDAVTSQIKPGNGKLFNSVKNWCLRFQGSFSINEIYNQFCIKDNQQKDEIEKILSDLCKENIIQQDTNKRSSFRVVDTNIKIIDLSCTSKPDGVDIMLPLGLSKYAALATRNIVVIAGDSNAGKTAIMLENLSENIMFSDRFSNPVYISTEMESDELRTRTEKIQTKDVWDNAEFIDYTGKFQDVIKAKRSDKLVYIDQLEVNESLTYADMETAISSIRHSLSSGIAIIAMQKTPGNKIARGGAGTLTKSRLYISLHFCYRTDGGGVVNRAEVVKCKMTKDGCINPEGRQLFFHITKSGVIEYVTEWEYVTDVDKFLLMIKKRIPEKSSSEYEIKFTEKFGGSPCAKF